MQAFLMSSGRVALAVWRNVSESVKEPVMDGVYAAQGLPKPTLATINAPTMDGTESPYAVAFGLTLGVGLTAVLTAWSLLVLSCKGLGAVITEINRQDAITRQEREQEDAFRRQCERESRYRRIAIEASITEARVLAGQLGFSDSWVYPFLGDRENVDQRLKFQSELVQKYSAEILGQNMQRQPTQALNLTVYGDARPASAGEIHLALQDNLGGLSPMFDD